MKKSGYKQILITGGAGFIGSFLADSLIKQDMKVRIFDNLENQVHLGKKPSYLNPKAEFIKGDVRDYKNFEKALDGIEVVFHLAARVGVAQSNYEIKDYVDTNIGGMANLLDVVANKKTSVKKIIMTASMTSYGEGDYSCKTCGIVKPPLRDINQLEKKKWDIYCPICGKKVTPIPTNESSTINNNSVYAFTKRAQEEMLIHTGNMFSIPVVSLRCFNVYGPRQSLSNPYTGVTAIFLGRLKNNNAPVIYENGLQTRDFVSVHDVVDILVKAMESTKGDYQIMNVGSGKATTIKEVSEIFSKLLKKNIKAKMTGKFRKNDIRHCFADIKKVKDIFGWEPQVSLNEGFKELITWSSKEQAVDLFEKAEKELHEKHLAWKN